MGVRILEGTYDGVHGGAVLVDSVTETAFGPLFESAEEAEAFLAWASPVDVRALAEPTKRLAEWRASRRAAAGKGDA